MAVKSAGQSEYKLLIPFSCFVPLHVLLCQEHGADVEMEPHGPKPWIFANLGLQLHSTFLFPEHKDVT